MFASCAWPIFAARGGARLRKPERCAKHSSLFRPQDAVAVFAPAPLRLFLPQAAPQLRSPPPFYRCPPCRCAAVLLRLAGFCGAPRRALAKIGALRQLRLAVSAAGSARLSCPPPGDRRETAPSFIGIAAVKVTPQRKPRRSSQRPRAPVKGRARRAGVTYKGWRAGLDHKSKNTSLLAKENSPILSDEGEVVGFRALICAAQFVPACFAHNSKREPASAK